MEEQRLRAADDFATIRSRLEELRRERERAERAARSAEEERRWPVSIKRSRGFSEFQLAVLDERYVLTVPAEYFPLAQL